MNNPIGKWATHFRNKEMQVVNKHVHLHSYKEKQVKMRGRLCNHIGEN